MTPDAAEQIAGRLGFAVSVMGDKVGRAFIKVFFMQAFHPTYDFRLSPLLVEAIRWWLEYLVVMPKIERKVFDRDRPEKVLWTDAAGSNKIRAALLWTGDRYIWTMAEVPPTIYQQFLHRKDDQILL